MGAVPGAVARRPWGSPGLTVFTLLVLSTLGLGCSSERVRTSMRLWTEDARWIRTEHGWARAVSLTQARRLAVEEGYDLLRAGVAPAGGGDVGDVPVTVYLESAEGTSERRIQGAETLELELGGAASATLSASAEVELLSPRLVRRGQRGRRLLLAVADTLRYDHATAERMPEVWSHFEDGRRYRRAYSPASWTLPSLASVFTGSRPAELRGLDGTLISLPPTASTLASKLAARGYAAVAVNANYTVNHENGFSLGFDHFLAPSPRGQTPAELPDASWIAARALELAGGFEGEDLFLYLQFMEPHEPYRDHETGESLQTPARGQPVGDRELEKLRAAYASEARYLSRQLGELLQRLGDFDLAVFTSDHGEELYDHGGFRHGPTLYEEVVRVPLWVRGRGVERETIEEPVSLTALADLFLGSPGEGMSPDRVVTMETFSFGPPRFASIFDGVRCIYFARAVDPAPAEHPTARWLREHHPRVACSTLEGEHPVEPGPELARRSAEALVRQFAGLRRGFHLLLEDGAEVELRATGLRHEGYLWGDADEVMVSETDSGKLTIEARGPRPFLFLSLVAKGEEPPRLFDLKSGRQLPLTERPQRLSEGASAWLDPGRPAAALRGQEETLRRLEALGYI